MRRALLTIPAHLDGAIFDGVALADHFQRSAASAGLSLSVLLPDARCPAGAFVLLDARYPAIHPHALEELAKSLDGDGGILVSPIGDVIGAAILDGAEGKSAAKAIADASGSAAVVVPREDALQADSRWTLSKLERIVIERRLATLVNAGVTLIAPDRVVIEPTVVVEPGATIWPDVVLRGESVIRAGSEIQSGCWIEDSEIGENALIKPHSVCSGARVGPSCAVGPMAHLRPAAHLETGVKVGNFVEVKKSLLRTGAKASHLTYIGDAEIGEAANIGAGTITANYDGFAKHRTTVGAGANIGSNTVLVAPVSVGAGVIVGAGSVVTRDVNPEALVVARAPLKVLEGKGAVMRERNRRAAEARKS